MFQLDQRGNFQATRWQGYDWLEHGFGTRLSGNWVPPEETATLKQIHSNVCVVVRGGRGTLGEGDSLVTSEVGTYLAIRTADCVPLLVVDPVRRAVAAVHAGWRGIDGRVTVATVRQMRDAFGSRPEDLEVAIGPAIGGCCYEVGPEVAIRFGFTGRAKVDLRAVNRLQLVEAGVRAERIDSHESCTYCERSLFDSFRREKEQSGRMVTAIRIRK